MPGANRLMEALKAFMRQKKVTYRNLSTFMNLSEASVKRIFASGDLSLFRLDEVCTFLGIDILELAKFAASTDRPISSQFTFDQELALAEDDNLFAMMHLLLRGDSVAEIVASHQLDDLFVTRLLVALDKNSLIELHAQNRIKLLVTRCVRWQNQGPLIHKYRSFVESQFLTSHFEGEQESLRFMTARIHSDGIKTIQHKIAEVIREVEAIADLQMDRGNSENQVFNVLLAYRPHELPLRFSK